MIVTNTIPVSAYPDGIGSRIEQLSIAQILADAIKRITANRSVSELFASDDFVDAGPVPRSFFARWEREAARRHVAARRRLPAARSYIRAAWVGAAPGQLAYAAAAVALPGVAERRLRRLETAQRLPEGWEPETEPWLAPYRTAKNVNGNNVNAKNVNANNVNG